MTTKKKTDYLDPKTIDSLKCPEGKTRLQKTDALEDGLMLRVGKSGKKIWYYQYTRPGTVDERTKMKLGRYPGLGLAEARKVARAAREQVSGGTDPQQDRKAKKASAVAAAAEDDARMTMNQLMDLRLSRVTHAQHQKRASNVEWLYNKHIRPLIGTVKVKDFRRSLHWRQCVNPLEAQQKFAMALTVHRALFSLMNFAIAEEEIEINPVFGATAPHYQSNCDRALSPDEIVTLWRNLGIELEDEPGIVAVIKLLLLTGQRSSEVAGMLRSEIDFGKNVWTIPGARTKNGKDMMVPLSRLALAIIREAMRKSNHDAIFPMKWHAKGMSSKQIGTAIAENRPIAEGPSMGIAYWTAHDLRHTIATHLAVEWEVPLYIVSAVCNHTAEGIKESGAKVTSTHYVKRVEAKKYLKEKTESLNRWGDYIANLVGEGEAAMQEAGMIDPALGAILVWVALMLLWAVFLPLVRLILHWREKHRSK